MVYMLLWYYIYFVQFLRLIKIILYQKSSRFWGKAWYRHSVDAVRLLLFVMYMLMAVIQFEKILKVNLKFIGWSIVAKVVINKKGFTTLANSKFNNMSLTQYKLILLKRMINHRQSWNKYFQVYNMWATCLMRYSRWFFNKKTVETGNSSSYLSNISSAIFNNWIYLYFF